MHAFVSLCAYRQAECLAVPRLGWTSTHTPWRSDRRSHIHTLTVDHVGSGGLITAQGDFPFYNVSPELKGGKGGSEVMCDEVKWVQVFNLAYSDTVIKNANS